MELQVYKAEIDASIDSDLEVNFIGLVERPAIERNFLTFNQQKERIQFSINEEDRVLVGPAMIADLPIYRRDSQLGEYLVLFSKETIKSIVQKFSAKGLLTNFNLFHDAQQHVSDVTIFNSFITNSKYGIIAPEQFKDVAEGSWFITAQINNDEVWKKVKSGEIKGFSIEGIFEYVPAQKVTMSNHQKLMLTPLIEELIEKAVNKILEPMRKLLNETQID